MGRGKSLSNEERVKIEVLKSENYSYREIAQKLSPSKNVVRNFLQNKENYGKNMKGRVSKATTSRDRRAILREASNSPLSAAKIRAKKGVTASVSTVRRVINSAKHLQLRKLKKKPPLNVAQKSKRLAFAKQHMTWRDEWKRVIFSDEKKFNMDGPDGFQHYFHDLRKEELVLSRNHSRQGGVMVWAAVTYFGTITLDFQSTKMNANTYKETLQRALLEIQSIFEGRGHIFQQDNAPIHTAKSVRAHFESRNIEVLPWPPYSPDLNIVENVWGWLSRRVYEGGKQYDNKNDLIEAIKRAWNQIPINYLQALYHSMPNRIYEVILKKGGNTHY